MFCALSAPDTICLGRLSRCMEHGGFGHVESSTFFPGLIPCTCLFIHNPGILWLPVRYAVVTIISLYVLNTSYSTQAVLSALPASFLCSRRVFLTSDHPPLHSSLPSPPTHPSSYNSAGPFSGETLPLFLCGFSFLTATLGAALYLHEGLCLILSPAPWMVNAVGRGHTWF